jgi:hypothetical protein
MRQAAPVPLRREDGEPRLGERVVLPRDDAEAAVDVAETTLHSERSRISIAGL